MAFVDHQQVIARQEVHQRPGMRPGRALVKLARIVLDPGAVPNLPQHFQVVAGALFDALGFEQFLIGLEECHPLIQFLLDIGDGLL